MFFKGDIQYLKFKSPLSQATTNKLSKKKKKKNVEPTCEIVKFTRRHCSQDHCNFNYLFSLSIQLVQPIHITVCLGVYDGQNVISFDDDYGWVWPRDFAS